MSSRTDALKQAQKNYIGKFARVEIRMQPSERDAMQAHAEARSESVNAFINRAIQETMERDNAVSRTAEGRTEGIEEAGE